jgi:lysophospholipase L1-like esterase
VALGDSVTTGYLSGGDGYPKLVAGALEQASGHAISTFNEGVNGATSSDLLGLLRKDQRIRDEVADADIVTVDIGGTDFEDAEATYLYADCGGSDGRECLRSTTANFQKHLTGILDVILELRAGNPTALRTVDVYASHVDLQSAGTKAWKVLLPYLRAINTTIAKETRRHDGMVAENFAAWNGPEGTDDPADDGLLASDGIHPNEAGQQAIADLLTGLGLSPLV